MVKIKAGFGDKETEIKIAAQANGNIELWIRQDGLGDKETLAYMTVDELHKLFQEVQHEGKDLFC